MVNPINHALTPKATARYKVEPHVVAADVYSTAPHEGRGGRSWYAGSAAWMYRAGIEGLLGLTRDGPDIVLNPCFPRAWPKVEGILTLGETQLTITIENPDHDARGIVSASMGGLALHPDIGRLRLRLTAGAHHLTARLG